MNNWRTVEGKFSLEVNELLLKTFGQRGTAKNVDFILLMIFCGKSIRPMEVTCKYRFSSENNIVREGLRNPISMNFQN